MSDLEKELGLALRREEPPEGFAERVLARIAEEPPAAPRSRRRPRVLYGLAAAAAAVAVFTLGAWRIAAPQPASETTAITAPPEQAASLPPTTEIVAAPEKQPVLVPATKREKPKRRVAVRRPAPPRQDAPSLAEAEHAKEQLMLALRIASDSLGTARRLVVSDQESVDSRR